MKIKGVRSQEEPGISRNNKGEAEKIKEEAGRFEKPQEGRAFLS
ncbi:MAG: hypothetical protein AB1847_07825 [bacterium]